MSDSNLPLLMGLDLGSSAVKGAVIDTAGEFVCSAGTPVTLTSPADGWVELDP